MSINDFLERLQDIGVKGNEKISIDIDGVECGTVKHIYREKGRIIISNQD